ncbi:MAG: lipoyl domain-containing protein [Actinomycetia bacterium]|nr:lipoyl domain-containing protein [Actinomycetes bacterium]
MSETIEVRVPPFGQSIDEALIVTWLVAPGQAITRGEPVVEVETAKATYEVPAEHDGVVESLLAAQGQIVDVGAPLYRLTVEPA